MIDRMIYLNEAEYREAQKAVRAAVANERQNQWETPNKAEASVTETQKLASGYTSAELIEARKAADKRDSKWAGYALLCVIPPLVYGVAEPYLPYGMGFLLALYAIPLVVGVYFAYLFAQLLKALTRRLNR